MRSLIIALLCLCCDVASAAGWVQFLDEEGVRGYNRAVEGSDLLMLRSTIVVPAKIEVVGAVLRDVESLQRPGTSCKEARLVEKRDHNSYVFYLAYDFPWPLSDRDVVLRVQTRYDLERGRVVSDLRSVEHPAVPLRDGHVRITDLESQFIVEYLGRDKTGVVFTSQVDPGGSLPAFLVNAGGKRKLKSDALDLRRACRSPEYLAAAAASTDSALVEQISGDPTSMRRIFGRRLAELIADRALIERLLAEPPVYAALAEGRGDVGETLLHGWGSRQSRAQALRALLRSFLSERCRNQEAVERFISDPALIDHILAGAKADAQVAGFVAGCRE